MKPDTLKQARYKSALRKSQAYSVRSVIAGGMRLFFILLWGTVIKSKKR